ncbi:MAG: aspartate--tRNA ligase [Eubacterium coprostanoligenes]|uniref:aspartate--tRNA ligase n=1 Tax=Eubacterium coprostanoligenes TaxID=290054 RepID=UPI0024096D41|nr:aspartate--tRNA ligase [Eubacterium coprostanoligenes]MDD6664910.1 aspartate--tRNA ligase [Eubacterium coprostanoligenes]
MTNSIKGMKRTDYCAKFDISNVGQTITVFGWVQRQRDLGNLIFIDLRDRTGIIQLSFNDQTDRAIFADAQSVRSEYVVAATGVVAERESKNKDIPTGEIEVIVNDFRIVSKAKTPPFEIEKSEKVGDETTLKYRYLNLRNEKLTKNILMRHEIAKIAREYFYANDFIEIETPMMIKSTPEGARDYVVPSRIHNGKFYALPQSPQIYKQLTMIAGFDRYIQLARCFRDEDLRADRQPEFTQIDLEMSFVDCDDIMDMAEGFISKLMKETIDVNIDAPLPRMTFADAMNKYGSDKPDTRFDMLIEDISDWADKTDFVVFKSAIADGGAVKAIVAKNSASTYTRKKIDKLTEFAKGIGAKGLAYVRWADEAPNCSFAKFLKDGELEELLSTLGAEQGDVVLIVSDKTRKALTIMGALRLAVAKELDLIPQGKWNFLWITEMPFFEMDEETGEWVAAHHPFTMPMEESIQYLDTDKSKVKAQAFDLVLNGTELSSGSMRITDCELQTKMFELLGMEQEEIDAKFGFLVDAYHYAAPPHGGMGIGLDRLAMLICGADSLRDVIAFPKVQNASELMSGAPSYIDDIQLGELGIDIKASEDDE